MKVLFCHDGPTYVDNKNRYYACVLSDNLIERYFWLGDEFTLLNRLRKIEKTEGLEEIKHKKVNIVSIPNLATLKGILFDSHKAKKIISDEVRKSDIVIARLPGFSGGYAIKYAKKYNKKYFVEMVGCPLDALSNHSFKGKLIAPVMYIYTRKLLKKSKYVMYVTNKYLQNKYPTTGYQIGCSDVDISIENEAIDNRLNKINTNNNIITLGTLGTLNMKYKGFDTVIKAISKINRRNGTKYVYKIMGNGDKTWLNKVIEQNKVADFVQIFNSVPHKDVFNWLDTEIDIYIQPSRTEGMPRALIEAMSRACLCIGSNAGGIPELIDSKYIFKKNNIDDLIKILENIKVEDLKNQAKINFGKSKDFSIEILNEKRKQFYKKVLK